MESVKCKSCGELFEPLELKIFNLAVFQRHCDKCVEIYDNNTCKPPPKLEPHSEIPKCYRNFTPVLLPQGSAEVAANIFEWRPGDIVGCGIVGKSNAGKSFIMFELMTRIKEKKFLTSGMEFGWKCGSPDAKERRDYLKRCMESPILYIDDLGSEKQTERVEADLYMVLETRRRNLLPLFVTMNLSPKDFEERLTSAARIINRLKTICKFEVIK